MKLYISTDESSYSLEEESTGECEATGYRLIDLQSLSIYTYYLQCSLHEHTDVKKVKK